MTRRSYGQYCALARALDVVGERWTLLVVRELLTGPQRFTDLLSHLPGIGTTLLSARLRNLDEHGIIRRRRLPPPAASTVYELTERGRDLGRSLLPLAMWGAQLLGPRTPNEAFRIEWLMLAFRGALEEADTSGLRLECEFHLDGDTFTARCDDGTVDVRPGAAEAPDVVVRTDVATFVEVGQGRIDPSAAADRVSVEGDPSAILELLRRLRSHDAASAVS